MTILGRWRGWTRERWQRPGSGSDRLVLLFPALIALKFANWSWLSDRIPGHLAFLTNWAIQAVAFAVFIALVTLRPDEVSVDVMARHSLLFSRGTIMRAVGETPHIEGAVPVTAEAFVQAAAIEALRSLHGYGGTEPNSPVSKRLLPAVANI